MRRPAPVVVGGRAAIHTDCPTLPTSVSTSHNHLLSPPRCLPPSPPRCLPPSQEQLEEAAADLEVLRMVNYNFSWPYHQDLGLYVAVDGAASIGRSLPAAAIISTSPPGSFYSVSCACGPACLLSCPACWLAGWLAIHTTSYISR